jgi:chemotaxis protein methyltransferase CheR
MHGTGFREQFTTIADAWALAQGIVDTVREPVLVLDKNLRVIAASRSFYSAFKVSPEDTQDRLLYALGDGQWDIPKLRVLLEKIIPEQGVMEGYEVEHEFPGLGSRTMCLNARQVFYEGGAGTTILLGMEDVTERRILEREKDELLRQKDTLFEELQHRIANSLQIIRKHHSDEGARGAVGRDAVSSGRRAQACLVDCCRAETATCIGGNRNNRNCALSVTVVR